MVVQVLEEVACVDQIHAAVIVGKPLDDVVLATRYVGPLAPIASDTTTEGEIIDTENFEALEFVILTKTITDGDYAVLLQEGDNSALSDAATVAAAETLGSPDFDDDTDDDAVARVGYIGKKRYVRLKWGFAATRSVTW